MRAKHSEGGARRPAPCLTGPIVVLDFLVGRAAAYRDVPRQQRQVLPLRPPRRRRRLARGRRSVLLLGQESLLRPVRRVRGDRVYSGTAGLDVGRGLRRQEYISSENIIYILPIRLQHLRSPHRSNNSCFVGCFSFAVLMI